MAQVTVTGNVKTVLGLAAGLVVNGGTARFVLAAPTPATVAPTVVATGQAAPAVVEATVLAGGNFTVPLQGNDGLSPAGTVYLVTFVLTGVAAAPRYYRVTGTTFTLTAANTVGAPVAATGGGAGAVTFVDGETPGGVVDGVNATFTLANVPTSGSLLLFRNGVLQTGGGVDYALVGTTVTLAAAPGVGDGLLAWYRR